MEDFKTNNEMKIYFKYSDNIYLALYNDTGDKLSEPVEKIMVELFIAGLVEGGFCKEGDVVQLLQTTESFSNSIYLGFSVLASTFQKDHEAILKDPSKLERNEFPNLKALMMEAWELIRLSENLSKYPEASQIVQ